MSYRFHELPRWFWVARAAVGLIGWASSLACIRLSVFTCLYLFACGGACAPPQPSWDCRFGILYISSLVKPLLSLPDTGGESRESTAYSQETAPPPACTGLSGHAENPAGTVPKYRPDGGSYTKTVY